MKFLVLCCLLAFTTLINSSLIHNIGGPLGTYPNTGHLNDLAFFFRLENDFPSNVFMKISNPPGFAF